MTAARAMLLLTAVLAATAARALEHSSYESLWTTVTADKDCTRQDDVDLAIFTCNNAAALWYFTLPDHPAHPGVVKRAAVGGPDGTGVDEHGWSFASDAAQPAFKTFLAQLSALDTQLRMALDPHSPWPAKLQISGNWQPAEGDNMSVFAFTSHYFALVDAGRREDAYALLGPELTAMLPFDKYRDLAQHTVELVGAVTTRAIKAVEWEKDKPGESPGLYAAVDYTAKARRGSLCGFIVWKRAADGFYTLVSEETNTLADTLSGEQAAKMRAQFHCVD